MNAMSLQDGLNPEQQRAVEATQGPLLIIAGAGSGKTSVMTRRIAYLLQTQRAEPWNILAITFTNRAAREMNDRVKALIGNVARDIWMCTFHAMCVKILRREAEHLGFDPNFTILDADDQMSAVKQCMLDLNHDLKKFDPSAIQWKISAAKNALASTAAMRTKDKVTLIDSITDEVYQAYQEKLTQTNVMDFDDLIGNTVRLFETHPDVLESYQKKFQYIHVDEYQDTNQAQYRLIQLLAAHTRNLCVVGDSDQAIYRWRGADISNLLYFERDYPEAVTIKLEQNYRSTTTILNAANAVIRHNQKRKEKNLWSDMGDGDLISIFAALDQEDEAIHLVATIQEHVAQGGQYRDCTVLYRANALSRVIEEACMQAAIPYKIIGGMTFYDRREIKDVMSYLKMLSNPQDEISLLRIVNIPKRNLGEATIRKLLDYAHDHDLTLLESFGQAAETGLPKNAVEAATKFHSLIKYLQDVQEGLNVTEFVMTVLRQTRYQEMYAESKKDEDQSRLENIEELLNVTRAFDRRRHGSLSDFLAETSLLSDTDKESGERDNAVRLMTMHASKGLEFPAVWIIGAEETVFPHARSMETDEDIEEERNLCYVAMTRARKKLHISYCSERSLFGQVRMNDPSRFLAEIPPELTEHRQSDRDMVSHWSIGMSVRHPLYGVGVVTDLKDHEEEIELLVTFASKHGTKSIKPKQTRLRVLNA